MPRLPLCIALLLATFPASALRADVVYDDSMHALGEYVQDFDDLPTINVVGHYNGDPNVQKPIPEALGQLSDFDGTRIAGNSTAGANLTANSGDFVRAGMYSVGLDGDRALGALADDNRTMAFGFSLLNQYAEGEITSITVEVYQETWRVPSTSINTFAAAWGTSATSGVTASNYLSAAGMTAVPDLSLVQNPAVPVGVDGNSAAYRTLLSYTFDVNLAFGERFYLRWQDYNDDGANAILAIDDLKLTFTHSSQATTAAVPEASSLTCVAAAGILVRFAARWRRRRPARRRLHRISQQCEPDRRARRSA